MTAAKKALSPDLIDQLLADYQKPEDLLGEHGIFKQHSPIEGCLSQDCG